MYGGTASGVMAAVAAARQGGHVLIIEPSRWLGGMTGGGISNLDWGRREAVGGSTYEILKSQPGNEVYRQTFRTLTDSHHIHVLYDHRLSHVSRSGAAIQSITLDYAPVDPTGCPVAHPVKTAAASVTARVFLDCSYEGDLLAQSGVSYTWGRESRAQYGESLAGVRPNLHRYPIDPYREPGNPQSGLLPFVQDFKIGPLGTADKLTMGYCFRYKFDTNATGLTIPSPKHYDPKEFELFRRAFQAGIDISTNRAMRELGVVKTHGNYFIGGDTGNLSRSLLTTTIYGCNAEYPNGGWEVRSKIWKFHQEFFCKLLHFLKTDPSVPPKRKKRAEEIRFRRGAFDDTQGWPSQLYIREARRMVAAYVITQKDLEGKTTPRHSIGLASYGVDDWPYATVVDNGQIALQGGEFSMLQLDGGKNNGIYPIPYEAIVPRQNECSNLLVPVCCSASHIAMTSIRMEPVWMILGESAGVAAALAVKSAVPVQQVSRERLRQELVQLGQRLDIPHHDERANSWTKAEWDRKKPGYEWVFMLIDHDANREVSKEEYQSFQHFKKEHADWENALRNTKR